MKFSIIIPFYQAEHHILVSLTSCLNQTYQNFEAIFIDDGALPIPPHVTIQFLLKSQYTLRRIYNEKIGFNHINWSSIRFCNSKCLCGY
ncbi:glycosyltransferase [Avibacterium paragallinarum]|uniref:glycosyltransferase n=1 Tax=Avibacterium paragallinarum TaxID=728 RepID=UPI002280B6FB|nr:glycosyltransferase [Avibacterium paragallinarum]WAL55930.1 glycosyltransferase [Avibacterium paragallinarum]